MSRKSAPQFFEIQNKALTRVTGTGLHATRVSWMTTRFSAAFAWLLLPRRYAKTAQLTAFRNTGNCSNRSHIHLNGDTARPLGAMSVSENSRCKTVMGHELRCCRPHLAHEQRKYYYI
tara:strand:- start:20263 stop:20616 length:354 start_codon:yes stop_codon:yes gene_type:complete